MRIVLYNDIRIENTPAALMEAITQALTIPNPAQVQAMKYGRSTWGLQPELTFYRQEGNSLILPRGVAGRILSMPAVNQAARQDNRLLCPEISPTFSGQLRPYQHAAVTAMLKGSQGVLQAGTGAGKTVTALAIIAARKQPALILVHNKELLDQWAHRAKQFLGIEAGRIGGGRFEVRPLTVGIVNTVRHRLEELTPHFGHVVVDECHRCPSAMFTECVDRFPAQYRLGLSATPYRRDGLTKVIGFFIGPKVHEVDAAHLREVGAILQPEVLSRVTGFRFHKDAAEHYQEMLTALTQDQARNALIADDIRRELARDAGTCLIVSDRVAHLEALRDCLAAGGVSLEVLTGQTPKNQRETIVEQVRTGRIKALGSTVQLMGEGFDCPGLSSLFLATPIKFSGRLLQVIGRILRPQAGKTPRVFDYSDPVGVLRTSAAARNRVYDQQGFILHAEAKTRRIGA